MAAGTTAERLTAILRDAIVGTVRRDGPDVTARQLAVFLICYTQEGAHTVRALAEHLEVAKPAISRTLDRLTELGLAKRMPDPRDRRSILVGRTAKGRAFLVDITAMLARAAKSRGSMSDERAA